MHRFANNVAGEDGVVGPPGPQGPEGPVGPTGRAVNNFNFGDTYCHTVVDTPTFNCYDFVSPSSNAENITNGWSHYTLEADRVVFHGMRFTGNPVSCFEVRFDGELPTRDGPNPLPAIEDGWWEYRCVNLDTPEAEIAIPDGTKLVEVRLVFGAENEERFNWEVHVLS